MAIYGRLAGSEPIGRTKKIAAFGSSRCQYISVELPQAAIF
jgi:hypothetical protein